MFPICDPKHAALLVIDMQYDYCSPDGVLPRKLNYSLNSINEMITRLSRFITLARKAGIIVIFLRMIEDPAFMQKNASDKINSFMHPFPLCSPGTVGHNYFGVSPLPEDIQIIKNSYDAFIETNNHSILKQKGIETPLLEDILKERQIDYLFFSGVLTSRCVDSTLRSAFKQGYTCVVPEDLVAMPDQLLFEHEAAISVWRAVFAYVSNSKDIANSLLGTSAKKGN